MESEIVDISEVGDLLKEDRAKWEPFFVQAIQTGTTLPNFEKNTISSLPIFEAHLKTVTKVFYMDQLNSAITRCVEYGYQAQLELLLERLDDLIKVCQCLDGCRTLDRRLMLRKIHLPCYVRAKAFGLVDLELEKRVALIQTIWRNRSSSSTRSSEGARLVYQGPHPEEYRESFEDWRPTGSPQYWGYRHSLYYLRWNRRHRYRLLRLIPNGDCRYQAWVDYLEPQLNEQQMVPEWVGWQRERILKQLR
jgi:hypothetical protein